MKEEQEDKILVAETKYVIK